MIEALRGSAPRVASRAARALALAASVPSGGSLARWRRAAVLVAGLAAVVWVRFLATVAGSFDALWIGLAFGVGLIALAIAGAEPIARTLRRPTPLAIGLGLGGGATLIGLALIARLAGPGIADAPAAPFLPWVGVTILVASGEELLLRGALFTAVERAGGVVLAVAITSVAFALMHVPLYGWHVVPLDLGVGIFLGGLRLAGGGWSGPAIAHAVADLATWWL
jgi:membrane protease YdiL (CAAX protease family)